MKNLEEGHLLAFTFETLGANRIWFKDYITLRLPSINQFRASDLQAKFCPLANKIWFIFILFHNFAPKLKNSLPALTIGRLIYCKLLCKDLLRAARWVLASLCAEDGNLRARGGGKSVSGQIEEDESTKWKEIWAVSFRLYLMFWRISQEAEQLSQIVLFYLSWLEFVQFWVSHKNPKALFSKGRV